MQLYRQQIYPKSSMKQSQNPTQPYITLTPNHNNYLVMPEQKQGMAIYEVQNSPQANFMQHQPSHNQFLTIEQNPSSFLPQYITTFNQPYINQVHTKSQTSFAKKNQTTNLEIESLVNAMNKSSLRQMSQGENIKASDIMALLSKTVDQVNRFSMLYQPKTQDLKHYFRIVQLNESELFPSQVSFSALRSCSSSQNDKKKYQLLITLDGKQLKFQSMNDRELHFNINLDTVQCAFLDFRSVHEKQYSIKFRVGQKIIQIFINETCLPFHLRNQDGKAAREYIERSAKQIGKYLKKAIEKSRGAQFQLVDLIKADEEYFLKNYATEQQFTQYCQTGDILLFKDRHTFAKIQRAITNSEYDHIAFVYRSQKYGVCLIESSSGFGVSLTVWTHLVRKHWFKGIDTISWRRLLIHEKPNDYDKKVEDFITANKNKKYGISFKKLLTFESSIKTQEQQKNRTYFCSQLVAQLYKYLGLLDQKVSSTQYWPKHFSQKGYLAMLKNSALDKERILVFDQKILKQNYQGYK